jgi:hypothetical protein
LKVDLEISTAILGLLAAILILLAAALAFVNDRLREADGPEGRDRIITRTMLASAVLLNLAGFGALSLFPSVSLPLILFSGTTLIQVRLFLTRPWPLDRQEVVLLGLHFTVYAILVSFVVLMHFLSRVMGILDGILKVL